MAVTLGQRLRELRDGQQLRLLDVSARIGMTVSHLSDLEHDRSLPSLASLHRIALPFDLSIADFLHGFEPYGT